MPITRRKLLFSALALAGSHGLFAPVTSLLAAVEPLRSFSGKVKFNLGIASYTFRKFDRKQVLEWARLLGVKYVCFKDLHLPLNATDDECAKVAEECRSYGVELVGCGTMVFKEAKDVDNAFRYATAAGMKHIVCTMRPPEKTEELLNYLDSKVKTTNVVVALHNHGPGDKVFPSAKAIYEKIRHLDKRIGFCVDIGHTARLGEDPIADLRVCPERIYDIHFKDMTEANEKGVSEVTGKGVLDMKKLFETLVDIGYDRTLSIEYEENVDNPLRYVAECVGYTRGMAAMF